MSIQSVGGSEPAITEGNTAAPGGASAAVPEVGQPFAVVDGQEFATPEALTEWWNKRQEGGGEETASGASTEVGQATASDTVAGAAGEDSLKGGAAEDALTDDQIKANLQKAGGIYADPKYEPFALEFEKTGDLKPESVKAAAEAFGIPESFVQEFVNNQKELRTVRSEKATQPSAQMVATAQAIVEVIPAEADYRALLQWGGQGNITAAEQAAYDRALDAGDTVVVKSLLAQFQSKFNASGLGKQPRDVTAEGAGTGASGGVTGYASSAEMQADMAKPEYQADPAFRAKVAAKVAASKF